MDNGLKLLKYDTEKTVKQLRSEDRRELLNIYIEFPKLYYDGEEAEKSEVGSVNSFFRKMSEKYLTYLESKLFARIGEEYSSLEEMRLKRRFECYSASMRYSPAVTDINGKDKNDSGSLLSVCIDTELSQGKRLYNCHREAVNFFLPDSASEWIMISRRRTLDMFVSELSDEMIKRIKGYDGIYVTVNAAERELHVYKNHMPADIEKKTRFSDFVTDETVMSMTK